MEQPFTTENWEATQEQCDKANEAYRLAAEAFFDGVNPDDPDDMERRKKWLCDKIGNYFNDDFTAAEIANWALSN